MNFDFYLSFTLDPLVSCSLYFSNLFMLAGLLHLQCKHISIYFLELGLTRVVKYKDPKIGLSDIFLFATNQSIQFHFVIE